MLQLEELTALLSSLRQAEHREGWSVQDLMKATGLSYSSASSRMRTLFQADKVRCVGNRNSFRMDGKPCHTPIYQFTDAPKPAKKARRSRA